MIWTLAQLAVNLADRHQEARSERTGRAFGCPVFSGVLAGEPWGTRTLNPLIKSPDLGRPLASQASLIV
jgi:hypothetical protein